MLRFRALPRPLTRFVSVLALVAWVGTMALLVRESYFRPNAAMAADLAKYGPAAQWRGIYYRGTKVGFTVSQVIPSESGYELHENGQLEMTLLGAASLARIRTTARVDRNFDLQSFEFSMDPGTGAVSVSGTVNGRHLALRISSGGAIRTQDLQFDEPPALAINIGRRLADGRLKTGARYTWAVFDPATLRNAPMVVEVGMREVVRSGDVRIPAFRVVMESAGLKVTSWVTDTGEIVREDSPLGLMTIRESPEVATKMAVSGRTRQDMLATAAVVPTMTGQIDDPRDVQRMRIQFSGVQLPPGDLDGAGQTLSGDVIEIRNPRTLEPGPADPDIARYLKPEAFIESDADEIRVESAKATRGAVDDRARAEQLVRYVNALLEKKPTISLPSAREVLRTKIGDCNEHTVLYVAMARAAGLPARIAVGLAWVNGAFYYHAWPEVYLADGPTRGYWLPVDPTFNQFPADGAHLRIVRGGLDRQAAILPLIGRLRMSIIDLDLVEGTTRVTVGASR
ncbi:MAG: transglutaminase-like domain-containing protein [Vicinamibacterales bacterium]